ncbi:ATP-grasp domain-containing protein [Streptomyces sp. RY43-2]|uniref:ATP-grasp domain-containing protein n=1 Tax=Streptomyces macrolidinus TaxID=2952607 RepID=A0ABT0ZIF2_9ACTN|nr:ATP-grasp domain-containing protein [Streptomyces macrolidinus]MCN9243358.1 ATP-grasp domain-containing protein [Streptomyces macrolidinus]
MPDIQPTAVLLNPRDLVVTAAQKLGLSIIVVADPEAPLPDNTPQPVLRIPWTTDLDALVEQLHALELPSPVSCFGFGELGSTASAVVNARLGWPGNPPEAPAAFKDKARLRAAVGDRAGAPVAYVTCTAKDELPAAIERIGHPCVVKPVDGTGSSGVRYLADREETERYLAALRFDTPHIVEEFLSGAEYSVEALSTQGGHRILAITEKTTTGAPHFVETGHTLPVRLDASAEAAIRDLVTGMLDAVGYRYGPSHTEIMLTAGGPRLIESHGRPGGDRISDLLCLALDEDVFAQTMATVLGLPAPPAAAHQRVAGIRFVTFDRTVPMPGISTELVASLPGVAEVAITVEPGQRPPEVRQSGDRHGFVVATGSTRDELETNLARAVRTLTATA